MLKSWSGLTEKFTMLLLYGEQFNYATGENSINNRTTVRQITRC